MNDALLSNLLAASVRADVILPTPPKPAPSPSPRLAVGLVAFGLVALMAYVFQRRTQGAK